MKKRIHLITNIVGVSSLFLLGSCRSSDTENSLVGGGVSAVSFNLLGTEYADPSKLSAQASLDKGSSLYSGNKIQRHSVLITPSNVITTVLSSSSGTQASSQASLGVNALAAVSGNPLASGIKFRVIAYKSNGAYQKHQDYTVGQTAVPMMLDNGSAYTIVIYSYGNTNLPAISSGEQNNLSSAVVNYDDGNRDFMYQNIPFTPVNANSTLNITLRHKVAQITAIVNSVFYGNITNITGGVVTPHYSNGSIALSSGVISGRSSATSGAPLAFSGLNTTTATSSPVFVNADTGATTTGGFSANVAFAGGATRTINLSNSFKIIPENKSNLAINLIKCGAFIGPNTDPANYREFMCHNLGADTTADPFTPAAAIHGAKYQWGVNTNTPGKYLSQSDDQANSGDAAGWIDDFRSSTTAWLDTSKTVNDPCPAGYRVPTSAQWQAVIDNNNIERVSPWGNFGDNRYDVAIYFRSPSNIRTLMLPTAGTIDNKGGTSNSSRGVHGGYWSSSISNSSGEQFYNFLFFTGTSLYINQNSNSFGRSVRCIANSAFASPVTGNQVQTDWTGNDDTTIVKPSNSL